MQRVWLIVACACLLAAIIFGWRGDVDGAFVAAALGVIAWFINYRNHLSRTIIPASDAREHESDNSGDVNEN